MHVCKWNALFQKTVKNRMRKAGVNYIKFRANRPKLCGNCAFPQSFHTRKLGEITAFYAVRRTWNKTKNQLFIFYAMHVSNSVTNRKLFYLFVRTHHRKFIDTIYKFWWHHMKNIKKKLIAFCKDFYLRSFFKR